MPRPWPARHKATPKGLNFLCPARAKPSLSLCPCIQAARVSCTLFPVYITMNKSPGIHVLSVLGAQVGQRVQDQEAKKEYKLARKEKSKAKCPPQGTCQEGTGQGRVWTLSAPVEDTGSRPIPAASSWVTSSKPLHLFWHLSSFTSKMGLITIPTCHNK